MPWRVAEYLCAKCGDRFESLETVPPRAQATCLHCLTPAELVISAPTVQAHSGKALYSVDHGPSQERPPWAKDTRAMAEPRKLKATDEQIEKAERKIARLKNGAAN